MTTVGPLESCIGASGEALRLQIYERRQLCRCHYRDVNEVIILMEADKINGLYRRRRQRLKSGVSP